MSSLCQLRNTARSLSPANTSTLAQSVVTTRLDCCCSLSAGLQGCSTKQPGSRTISYILQPALLTEYPNSSASLALYAWCRPQLAHLKAATRAYNCSCNSYLS